MQIKCDLLKNVAPGMVGVQTIPRNSRQIYYYQEQKRKLLTLHGTEEQNIHDIKEFIRDEVKDSSTLPLERWVLMTDNTRFTIKTIIDVLHKRSKELEKHGISTPTPPLLFHYDTTFNVGNNFVSILTLRDPTKQRLGIHHSSRHVFVEPILPIAVMVHQGKRREQHEAFFKVIDKQLDNITFGSFSHEKKVVVCDHEFGNVWKGAQTIFCKTHMERNIKEFLRKNKLGSRGERNPVVSQFHALLNCGSYDKFLCLKKNLEIKNTEWNGAMAHKKVREYLLTNIVPKIESNAGR